MNRKSRFPPEMTYLMIKPPIFKRAPESLLDKGNAADSESDRLCNRRCSGPREQGNQALQHLRLQTYSDEFSVVQNDNLLAWMTPDSDGVLAVRRNAISWLENNFGRDYGKTFPGLISNSYGFRTGAGSIRYFFIRLPRSRVPSARLGVRYNNGPVLV